MNLDELPNPKLSARKNGEWESLFPYYAGFSKDFAEAVIVGTREAVPKSVLDPWNGAGTTTLAAAAAGSRAAGVDINPVMNVVARARAVAREDADILLPLAELLINAAATFETDDEPLSEWFDSPSAIQIRALAQSIRLNTMGGLARLGLSGRNEISGPTAIMFVALFAACKSAVSTLKTSNPTWLKAPREEQNKISLPRHDLHEKFLSAVASATAHAFSHGLPPSRQAPDLRLGNAENPIRGRHDLVLTSPPYCTRIDYAQLTKLEYAILCPDLYTSHRIFRSTFTGTTLTRKGGIRRAPFLGRLCNSFLSEVKSHHSRASSGYYYKSHVDYFNKMSRAIRSVSRSIRSGGQLVLVVQDSWYKDIHNDVPGIISEFCDREGLIQLGRRDFPVRRSFADVHKHRASYKAERPISEVVMGFARR